MRRTPLAGAVVSAIAIAAAVVPSGPASADTLTLRPTRVMGASGHAGLYGWGVTTLLDGDVLVGDYWNMRVLRFGPDGSYKGIWLADAGFNRPEQHQAPYGLATDPITGDVYLADTDRYSVKKYTADGTFIRQWGTQGTGADHFLYPSRIAVASDRRVYVVDTWDNCISVTTPEGQELFQFGSFGTGPGQLKQPHGAAFDAQDRLFVADSKNQRVSVFDRDGTFLYAFGGKGTVPGSLSGDLRGLAVDKANGWVYVVDGEANRINKFATDGTFLKRWGGNGDGPGQFHDGGREASVGLDGTLWVGDMPSYRMQRFSPEGVYLGSYPDPALPPPAGGFNAPRGAAVDAAGNLFVSDTYNFRIQKLAPNGAFVTQWGRRGRAPYEFNYTRMIAVDRRDGSVVLADTDNHRIKKYDSDGTFLWELGGLGAKPGQFKNPHGVDVAADGTILVADTQNQRVQLVSPAGVPLSAFGSKGTGNGQFGFPRGIAADPDGTIWVADSGRGTVQHFSATGTYLGKVGTKGTADNQLAGPFDVAVNATAVFVADTSAHKVKVFDKAGNGLGAFGGRGGAVGQLVQPQGLDILGNQLYVTDSGNDRVQVWTIGGTTPPDTVKPTAKIVSPASGAGVPFGPLMLSGTAADNVGVLRADVAIQDQSTSLWWDGVAARWGTLRVFNAAQLIGLDNRSLNWRYPFLAGQRGRTYSVLARGVDAARINGNPASGTFKVAMAADTAKPDTVVLKPGEGQVVTSGTVDVSGTASDDSTVQFVSLRVQDVQGGRYWDALGARWAVVPVNNAATLVSQDSRVTAWSRSLDADLMALRGGSGAYTVTAAATDGSSNTDPTPAKVSFAVTTPADGQAPDTSVTSPRPAEVIPAGQLTLSGTARDDVRVAGVQLALQDRTTGLWWDPVGAAWSGQVRQADASVTAASGGWSWSWQVASATLAGAGGSGSYLLVATAQDGAGHPDPTPAEVAFTVS